MIEAALKFILKVGKVLQERGQNTKTDKDGVNKKKQEGIFARFVSMEQNSCSFEVSQRFQLLIKNMLDDRAQGW